MFKEMFIIELFDTPSKVKKAHSDSDFDAWTTIINDKKYVIVMNKIPLNDKKIGYNIAFKFKDENGKSVYKSDIKLDNSEILSLFSTILEVLKNYDNISYLEFEPNEDRKVKLYNTFAKKLKSYFKLDNVQIASKDQKIKIYKGETPPKYKKKFLNKLAEKI